MPTTSATQHATAATLAPSSSPTQKKSAHLTLWPLVAATFFMVSGGTYGTEDIVHGAGYGRAILILLLTPLLWSLPTAFMIGELASALPREGGYYAWVRRALGKFWGFQEAWLSLAAQHLRHGDLPDAVRRLPRAAVSVVRGRTSRRDGGTRRGGRLHAAEHRGHSSGRDDVAVAVRCCSPRRSC